MNKIPRVIIGAGCSRPLPWVEHISLGKTSSPSWRVEREYFPPPHLVGRIYWEVSKIYMSTSTLLVHSHPWLGMFPEAAVIQGEMSDGSKLSRTCSVEGSSKHTIEMLPEHAEHMPTILPFANYFHACYIAGVSMSDLKLTPLCS